MILLFLIDVDNFHFLIRFYLYLKKISMKNKKFFCSLVVLHLVLHSVCFGQDGVLDSTFDDDGIVTTSIANQYDIGKAIAIQNDGKIIIGGSSTNINGNLIFGLVRYNINGSLDTTFNSTGKVTTIIGFHDQIQAIAIQNDGKIVAVGTTDNGTSSLANFAIIRYNSDGSLDTSFGNNGKVITAIGPSNDWCNAVAIQNNGKIVVTGGAALNLSTNVIVVARYNYNGTLDSTFGLNGKVTTSVGNSCIVNAVFTRDDGKIEVAGNGNSSGTQDFVLLRYNSNGTLDTTFDSDGIVTTDFENSNEVAISAAKQNDGKIILIGYNVIGNNYDFALARYNTDGSLDSTFDGDGKLTTDFGTIVDYAYDIAIQSDGKIIASGYNANNQGETDFLLSRYTTNGSLDPTFGVNGKVITSVNNNDLCYSVAIQNDGKILAAGSSSPQQTNFDFTVVRYNSSLSNQVFDEFIKIYIFPNPVYDILKIELQENIEFHKAIIYNNLSQLIKEEKNREINVKDLSKGTYFIEIVTDKGKATKTFIKE